MERKARRWSTREVRDQTLELKKIVHISPEQDSIFNCNRIEIVIFQPLVGVDQALSLWA